VVIYASYVQYAITKRNEAYPVTKKYAALKKAIIKRCETQGGSQKMAVMVG